MSQLYFIEQIIKLTPLLIPAYQFHQTTLTPKVVLTENNKFEFNNIF